MSAATGPKENLPINVTVPEKHYSKWLQIQSHIVELKIWVGFAKFVLSLMTIAGLILYIGNKSPEALRDLLPIIGVICSLAGVGVSIHKYLNRNKREDV